MNTNILLLEFNPITSSINSASIMENTFRLDSQYYALFDNEIGNLNASSFLSLNECCFALYEVPIFKHIYVKNGIPFYTSSDIFNNELIPSHFLTPEMQNIEVYKLKKNQILMARSGNVERGILGQILIVGEQLNEATASDHVLRFSVNDNVINVGYLAAFLMSKFCKGQLLKNASGAVIPAIRPDSLKDLQIPITSKSIQRKIGKMMLDAVDKRDEAILKLNKARSLTIEYNNLPSLDQAETDIFDSDDKIESETVSTSEFTNDFRLDAHFYNPIAKKAVINIDFFSCNNKILGDITSDIIIGKRFKRNYVESDYGTPFLSGKNIIQTRPDLKYLSDTEISFIDELLIKKNWTLITCSGTLGRTCFVYNNYEDYAASQHILRVVPNEEIIDPGYLYCFLSTDYGYHQIVRNRYGSVIDEIDEKNLANVKIPIPDKRLQKEIGDLVRQAYDLRSEAILLEDKAQDILTKALTNA